MYSILKMYYIQCRLLNGYVTCLCLPNNSKTVITYKRNI